jgi:hypothetical protein
LLRFVRKYEAEQESIKVGKQNSIKAKAEAVVAAAEREEFIIAQPFWD